MHQRNLSDRKQSLKEDYFEQPKSSTMDINTLAQMTKLHPNVVIENSLVQLEHYGRRTLNIDGTWKRKGKSPGLLGGEHLFNL